MIIYIKLTLAFRAQKKSMKSIEHVNWPPIAAAEGTHQETLKILAESLDPNTQGSSPKVLDMPCGAGAFANAASQVNFDVIGMDIHPNEPYFADPEKRVIADGNQALPFDDEHFDAVCSIEGIEHLENPSFFLRELCRITKKGGLALVSTPNVDSYRSRRNMFFRGYHRYFRPETDTHKDSGHIHPIDLYYMLGALSKTDFELVKLSVNRMEGRSGPTLWREFVRKFLSVLYPDRLKSKVPFYGDVLIYVLRKSSA